MKRLFGCVTGQKENTQSARQEKPHVITEPRNPQESELLRILGVIPQAIAAQTTTVNTKIPEGSWSKTIRQDQEAIKFMKDCGIIIPSPRSK